MKQNDCIRALPDYDKEPMRNKAEALKALGLGFNQIINDDKDEKVYEYSNKTWSRPLWMI